MKSRYLLMGLWLGAAIGLVPQGASAAGEQITNLVISAHLSKSDVLDVTEQISYNFGGAAPHPITHGLPLIYQDDQGRQFTVAFRLLSTGATSSLNGGDTEITLPPGRGKDPHRYVLHYTLTPVVLSGLSADVLKFSATGLGWSVPVNHITLTLQTPAPAANLTCYTGSGAATSASCQISQSADTTTVVTDAVLPPSDNLSVFGNFPSNTFSLYLQPSEQGPSWVVLGLGVVILLGGVAALAVWLARRPPRPRRRVSPPPPAPSAPE